jgi:hypothetical protein
MREPEPAKGTGRDGTGWSGGWGPLTLREAAQG